MKRMPVVRVENYLLFPGGAARKISRVEQLQYALKIKKTVKIRPEERRAPWPWEW